MNIVKLLAPDFAFGKALVMIRAYLNLTTMLILRPSRRMARLVRCILRVKPRYTMVTSRNLLSLYNLVCRADSSRIAGDIVECGVWNGGSAALMALAAHEGAAGRPRQIWLFDSFQGLPPPSSKDGAAEQKHYFEGLNKGAIANVGRAFQKLGLTLENTHITPGWFNETLHKAPIEQIAVLHIDADWYESVKVVLDTFYDRVMPGGFVALDDYGYWEGCKRALDDFCAERGLAAMELVRTDRVGAYFQKPRAA